MFMQQITVGQLAPNQSLNISEKYVVIPNFHFGFEQTLLLFPHIHKWH